MIADYKKTSRKRWAGAMLLVAVLACVVLTNAYVAKADFTFGTPTNLGPTINTSELDGCACFSPDNSTIFFMSGRTGGYGSHDLWQVSILPIVDFNTDGIVDCVDICMLMEYWDTNEPLYDIAPVPFGDGIVDVQDLIVLTEHLTKQQAEPNAVTP